MDRITWRNVASSVFMALCVAISGALYLTGCGGEEEPVPSEETQVTPAPSEETPVETAAPGETPAKAMPPVDIDAPVTLRVLRLMPEESQIALAVPSASAVLGTLRKADKYFPEPFLVAQLEAGAAALGEVLGSQDKSSFEAIAAQKGLDPDGPLGIFVDVRPLVEIAKTSMSKQAKLMAATESELGMDDSTEPPDASDAQEAAEDVQETTKDAEDAAEAKEDAQETPVNAQEATENKPPMEEVMALAEEDVTLPDWVAVLPVLDQTAVEAFLREIAGEVLEGAEPRLETVGDQTLELAGNFGYFMLEDQVVVGSEALLRSAAGRVSAPATFRYGTTECPPSSKDEIVALLYGNRLLPAIKEISQAMAETEPATAALFQQQIKMLEEYEGVWKDDPGILSISWEGDRLEILGKTDANSIPGVLEKYGEPGVMRLPQLAPENTMAILALFLPDAYKTELTETMLPAMAQSAPEMGAGAAYAKPFIQLLGNEAALAIGGGAEEIPSISLAIEFADLAAAKPVLSLLIATEPHGTYKDLEVGMLAMSPMFPILQVCMDNYMVLSTDEETLHGIVDLYTTGASSGLLSSLTPPMNPEKPRYSMLVVKSGLLETLLPFAQMMAPAAGETPPELEHLMKTLLELRAVKDMRDSWIESRLTLRFAEPL